MAGNNSFSVKAVLSAVDKGFTTAFKEAGKATESLGSKIKSGLGFGILTGIGQKAFDVITQGATDMVGELSSSSAAWKTFTGNMEMLGKGRDEIKSTKNELQDFATKTIYSASDMATTYSQLAAVGTKNCTQLVKGFGGLASAAENPQQAMKTLSQQATQMASKPKVEWQDFKLMLEQTPAGVAAVARQMGMSTSQLVKNVQDGKVKTQDFFNAISKVGTNKAFTKLATEYKTVDQAMDGLKETLSVKLAPAFDAASKVGISSINKIIDKMDGIDAGKIVDRIGDMATKVKPYWEAVKGAASDAAQGIMSVVKVAGELAGEFITDKDVMSTFTKAVRFAGTSIKSLGKFVAEHKSEIKKAIPIVVGFIAAWKGYKVISSAAKAVGSFADKIRKIPSNPVPSLPKPEETLPSGEAMEQTARKMVASGKAFALAGAGVLLISAGFALLAYSSIQLANAGPLAIGVMAGMVGALMAVGGGITFMIKALAPAAGQLNAVGPALLMVGGAVLLVSAGISLLSYSAIQLAAAGPLAIGVMVGMVAAIAGLAVGAAAIGPALTAGAVGFIAFGAAIALVGAGALMASAGLVLVAGALPAVVQYGASGAVSIAALAGAITLFGLGTLAAVPGTLLLGAALLVLGTGAAVAGAGAVVLGAGMAVVGAGLVAASGGAALLSPLILAMGSSMATASAGALAFSASLVAFSGSAVMASGSSVALGGALVVSSAGMVAFGASVTVASAGMVVLSASLVAVRASLSSISGSAKSTSNSLKAMKSSVSFVSTAMKGLGSMCKSAVSSMISSFSSAETRVVSAGRNIGNGAVSGLKSGMSRLPSVASSGVGSAANAMRSGHGKAYSAGVYIGQGLAGGMRSTLGEVRSVAAQLASAADAAIRAKAKIHSPSRVSMKLGEYFGQGFANGIAEMSRNVRQASAELFSIPRAESPSLSLSGGYGGTSSLDQQYSYSSSGEYTIVVPVKIDGREVARTTASYTQQEIDRAERFQRKIRGGN